MTVQDLLMTYTDANMVAQIWERNRPSYAKPLDLDKVTKKIKDFIKHLSTLDVSPNDTMILAMDSYEDGQLETFAELFEKNEFYEKANGIKNYNIPSLNETMATEEIKQCTIEMYDLIPQAYDYTFSDWTDTLGASVYSDNFYKPSKLQNFIAALLYEMSFNGMTKEIQQERRDELDRAIQETDKIKNLPEEEQKAHDCPLKDVFDEYGIKNEETQEEKELQLKKIYIDAFKTWELWINEFQNLSEILLKEKDEDFER